MGTGNGYYLFRMADQRPASVLGLDPTIAFRQCFEFLNAFYPTPQLEFSPAGFDALSKEEYAKRFDTIFCLGIVYHHTDPIQLLRILHQALRPGGELLLESLALPASVSNYPVALTPAKGRYGGGGGNWHVPNALCLEQWLRRSGFRDIVSRGEYEFVNEQVRTADLPGLAGRPGSGKSGADRRRLSRAGAGLFQRPALATIQRLLRPPNAKAGRAAFYEYDRMNGRSARFAVDARAGQYWQIDRGENRVTPRSRRHPTRRSSQG